MDTAHIANLLRPFASESELPPLLLQQLQSYLDLLLRWNARMNLTAVRAPDEIVTRHFGESLFAGQLLGGSGSASAGSLADFGSGAGFPGIPIKLLTPELALTLIESQHKKATFLREVLRALQLEAAEVFSGRAEHWGKTAEVVTLRAVEQFERTLPVAAKLVTSGGKLCLLIGTQQVATVQQSLIRGWTWDREQPVPNSSGRVVLIGIRG